MNKLEQRISAFTVVLLPEFAEHLYFKKTPVVSGKNYRGIDRLPWTLHSENKLGRSIIKKVNDGYYGIRNIPASTELNDALTFMEFDQGKMSEIIGLHIDGAEPENQNLHLDAEYVGFDTYAIGQWSLNRSVMFQPSSFKESLISMNKYGLFETRNECEYLINRYNTLSKEGVCEPLGRNSHCIAVGIYIVHPVC